MRTDPAPDLDRWRRDPLLVLWTLLPAAVWATHGFHDVLGRDAALYVYAGQAVAEGEAPYARVMNRAGPLAHLLPGLGVTLGRTLGVSDVVGVRVLYFALAAVLPVLVYAATRLVFGTRLGGCVAAGAVLGYQGLAELATDGPDSKLPMVVLLTVALFLLMDRRLVMAGMATALTTLTWQPAFFALAGGALVMALTHPGGWRARWGSLGGFALGGSVTAAVMVGYFVVLGELRAFLDGFVRANAYTQQSGLFTDVEQLWVDLVDWFGWTVWVVVAGLVLVVVLAFHVRRGGTDPMLRDRTLALAVVVVAAFAWSTQAFQSGRDALMFLPPASMALGGAAGLLVNRLDGSHARRAAVAAAGGWIALASVLTAAHLLSVRTTELRDDRRAAEAVFAALPPDATVMVAQAPQPLALTGRDSLSRYVIFTNGMRFWIDSQVRGGLDAYRDWVDAERPTVLFTAPPGPGFLSPLTREFECLGLRSEWYVWLRKDVDPTVRAAVAQELATIGTGVAGAAYDRDHCGRPGRASG